MKGLSRRNFLIAAAAGAAGAAVFPARGRAAERPFTFTSWGGALSNAEKDAFIDPFAKLKGIEVINTSPTETAKIKAMVSAGKVEWDLVDVGGRTVWQGAEQGFLEKLDMSKIPNASALDQGWVSPYGIATSTGATIIAWSKSAFPDGGPQSWADFWDVKRFAGPRGLYKYFYYNYEAALLAAGLKPSEVFPYTAEKADQALAKIKELKPNVTVWWGAGAQPPQLLSSGELAASSAWSGRMLAASKEGAPIDFTYKDGIAWANWWVIPKGTPYAAVANEAINFALDKLQQEKLLALKTYGPVLGSATAAADPETMKILVMAPKNIKDMLILNEEEANKYSIAYEEKWNQLMLG
ncbi:putative spermidine/putrescine transport system substrate-binding protein [Rhodoligotrophos appendicifer]|uniref:ABC transporter substrate-binding protein n=1 Tax=Rhodoligotrophos appendicifer TaxID=987056 RepID=UPI001185E147|nr:ABC transporter substrate-binding protein [Rhodoligotrophos appendicifer]